MENVKNCVTVCDIFQNPPWLNIKFWAGAGATSRCGSGSTNTMRLLAALTLQHWLILYNIFELSMPFYSSFPYIAFYTLWCSGPYI
jgi:hypothetical protein